MEEQRQRNQEELLAGYGITEEGNGMPDQILHGNGAPGIF